MANTDEQKQVTIIGEVPEEMMVGPYALIGEIPPEEGPFGEKTKERAIKEGGLTYPLWFMPHRNMSLDVIYDKKGDHKIVAAILDPDLPVDVCHLEDCRFTIDAESLAEIAKHNKQLQFTSEEELHRRRVTKTVQSIEKLRSYLNT